jgi:acetate kinase
MSGCIAVINAGSSSVKFALYEIASDVTALFRGQVEGIGVAPRLTIRDAHGETVAEREWSAEGFNHDAATREILTSGATLIASTPVTGIGHRVEHGGCDTVHRSAGPGCAASLAELTPLAPCTSRTTWLPFRQSSMWHHIPRLPASTQRSIVTSRKWLSLCVAASHERGHPTMASMACHTNTWSPSCARSDRHRAIARHHAPGQRRSLCASGMAKCREHDGITAVDGLMMGTRCGAPDAGAPALMRDTIWMPAPWRIDLPKSGCSGFGYHPNARFASRILRQRRR